MQGYLLHFAHLLNPVTTNPQNATVSQLGNADVLLYAMQNLQKVEEFCQQQAQAQSGINKLHFEDLLREIKLIRDRRTTVK